MTELLIRLFIKDGENTADPAIRQRYGTLSGMTGILLNLLLCLGKLIAGAVAGSIAITADAFNNLSDAGSSIVTLIGFRLAGQKPDRDHPFGHGRIEYLSGLAVSVVILLMGVELLKTSVEKIFHPADVSFGILPCAILIVSMLVKGWMCLFNRRLGEKIGSAAMLATAADSLSDVVSTGAVLVGTAAAALLHLPLDGPLGILVALFILYTGIQTMKDTIDPLLGKAPEPELVAAIEALVLQPQEIVGIHDLIIHDYGPGRLFASLHAEVSRDDDLIHIHDIIDAVEREVLEQLGCEISIHMDPIAVNDELVQKTRLMVAKLLEKIDPTLTFHDFRMTDGPNHINLIFDVVRPLECRYSPAELKEEIMKAVAALEGSYYAVVTIDTPRV